MAKEFKNIVVDVWGDFALFTRPECKVERMSYQCITPSAARGILCSIYMKPIEFYYEIEKIEIMNEIKFIGILRNEVKEKIAPNLKDIIVDIAEHGENGRTQRHNEYLKNVYYRIYAKIIKREDNNTINITSIYEQFQRRIKNGKCFAQPFLGTRECVCHFKEPDYSIIPNKNISLNIGTMLYDVFDITSNEIFNSSLKQKDVIQISYFEADIKNGVLDVPPFESPLIRRL